MAKKLLGQTFVVTGTLASYSRALGGKVSGNVSANTDITSVNHLDHEMKVTYLNEKPEPRNPITLAIIADSETVYDQKVLVMIYGEAIDMMNKICSNTIATSGRNMSKDGEPS